MLVVVVAIAALALWAFVFLPPDDQLWRRTVVAAGVMIVGCSAILVAGDRFGAVVGPFTPAEVAIGLGIGGAWLAATHLGHRVLCRLFPSFIRQVSDLYRKGTGDSTALMVGAVTAMAVAEELLFRGIVQERAGLVVGVAVYAGVQAVERKWVLVLAAALCGTVWGALFLWRDGLVAPIVAHVLWTGALLFVWPLPPCSPSRGVPTRAVRAPTPRVRDAGGSTARPTRPQDPRRPGASARS